MSNRPVPDVAQLAFALTLIAMGVLALVQHDFTSTWNGVRDGAAGYQLLVDLTGAISILSGAGLLWRRTGARAAALLLAAFVGWAVVLRVPGIFSDPFSTGTWWPLGDSAAMIATAWILLIDFATDRERIRFAFLVDHRGRRIAEVFFGLALIPFGVAHFTFLDRTVSMVPAWLPWHLFWAVLTGVSMMLAGVMIAAGFRTRLLVTFAATLFALFTLLVWGPIALGGPDAALRAEMLGSVVLTIAAWVVADSYRGRPWLAPGTPSTA